MCISPGALSVALRGWLTYLDVCIQQILTQRGYAFSVTDLEQSTQSPQSTSRTEALLLQLQPKRCCWLGTKAVTKGHSRLEAA